MYALINNHPYRVRETLIYLKLACDADSIDVDVSVTPVPGVEGFLELAIAGISSSESVRSTLCNERSTVICW